MPDAPNGINGAHGNSKPGHNGHDVGAVHGAGPNGAVTNGHPMPNGTGRPVANGRPGPSGAPVNGGTVNGAPANGAPMNGAARFNGGAPVNGGTPVNGGAPANGAPMRNGTAKAPEIPHAEATRISQALSGQPNGSPRQAPQQPWPQKDASRPGLGRAAAPGRPSAPADPDLEATTQHAPVVGAPEEAPNMVPVNAAPAPAAAPANAAAPASAAPTNAPVREWPEPDLDSGPVTQHWEALAGPVDEDETSLALPQLDPELAPDEEDEVDYEDDFEYDYDGDESEEERIDATLARFSAVHDEIAQEEADRRKKFSWLFGMRREPELGRDMPFDFVEGRDAQESRMQWKKEERKQRAKRLAIGGAIAAAVLVVLLAVLL